MSRVLEYFQYLGFQCFQNLLITKLLHNLVATFCIWLLLRFNASDWDWDERKFFFLSLLFEPLLFLFPPCSLHRLKIRNVSPALPPTKCLTRNLGCDCMANIVWKCYLFRREQVTAFGLWTHSVYKSVSLGIILWHYLKWPHLACWLLT